MCLDLLLSPSMIAWMLIASIVILVIAIILVSIIPTEKEKPMTEELPVVKKCIECGEKPKYTEAKGNMPTKVHCKNCDREASSGISPERAIQIWNRMNAKERD